MNLGSARASRANASPARTDGAPCHRGLFWIMSMSKSKIKSKGKS